MEDNFFTPFLTILEGLAKAAEAFISKPGYFIAWGIILLAGFCFVVLTGGDDQ